MRHINKDKSNRTYDTYTTFKISNNISIENFIYKSISSITKINMKTYVIAEWGLQYDVNGSVTYHYDLRQVYTDIVNGFKMRLTWHTVSGNLVDKTLRDIMISDNWKMFRHSAKRKEVIQHRSNLLIIYNAKSSSGFLLYLQRYGYVVCFQHSIAFMFVLHANIGSCYAQWIGHFQCMKYVS